MSDNTFMSEEAVEELTNAPHRKYVKNALSQIESLFQNKGLSLAPSGDNGADNWFYGENQDAACLTLKVMAGNDKFLGVISIAYEDQRISHTTDEPEPLIFVSAGVGRPDVTVDPICSFPVNAQIAALPDVKTKIEYDIIGRFEGQARGHVGLFKTVENIFGL